MAKWRIPARLWIHELPHGYGHGYGSPLPVSSGQEKGGRRKGLSCLALVLASRVTRCCRLEEVCVDGYSVLRTFLLKGFEAWATRTFYSSRRRRIMFVAM